MMAPTKGLETEAVGLSKDERAEDASAAELLGDWRAAKRDTVAAGVAATVADLAMKAASAATEAATEAQSAVAAAVDAAERAKVAATRANKAATLASEAATILAVTAEGDKVRANHAVELAVQAEDAARDRFHDAENEGFPTHRKKG